MSEFSIRAFKQLIREQGDKRVSEDSGKELRQLAENYAEAAAKKAIDIADQNDRKTVRKEDIRKALREVQSSV